LHRSVANKVGAAMNEDASRLSGHAQQRPVEYVCGECGRSNKLRPTDHIQCRSCGYRILYKKRVNEVVQFEAR